MAYREEDFLMLSGIQHFAFCRRQWALIHVEQQWEENVRTVEGQLMHKRAHDKMLTEKSKDKLVARSLSVRSYALGIAGECDVVEFWKSDDGVRLQGHRGNYRIYPVEYKRGRPKSTEIDHLQLAAQAMCLEEMFSTDIEEGAMFYGETRRREPVAVSPELREKVTVLFREIHQLYQRGYTPKVRRSKSCNACSLKELCLPQLEKRYQVNDYINRVLEEEIT